MKYTYFLSYNHATSKSNSGFGMVEVFRDRPIENFRDIQSIAEGLQDKFNLGEVIILNYQLLNN